MRIATATKRVAIPAMTNIQLRIRNIGFEVFMRKYSLSFGQHVAEKYNGFAGRDDAILDNR